MKYSLAPSTLRLLPILFLFASSLDASVPVSGRVTVGGKPVDGARVTLHPMEGTYARGKTFLAGLAEAEAAVEVKSDAGGFFRLAAPDVGVWRVRIEAPGSMPVFQELDPLVDPMELPVAELVGAATVEVRLLDAGGKRLSGRVLAFLGRQDPRTGQGRPEWEAGWTPPTTVFRTDTVSRTDEEGRLEVSVQEDKDLFVYAVADGYVAVEKRFERPKPGEAVEIRLVPGRPRALRVVDADGRPVAGVLVTEWDARLPLAATGDDGGAVVVQGAGALRLKLLAEDGGYAGLVLQPPRGEDTPAGPVKVTLSPPRRVTGRVIDRETRRPVPGALVWSSGAFTRTGTGGGYTVVQAGTSPQMVLQAAASGYARDGRTLPLPSGGSVDGPTFALKPAAVVSGRVVDEAGEPLEGVEVSARQERRFRDLVIVGGVEAPYTARTAADGVFLFTSLPSGAAYELAFHREGYAEATESLSELAPREEREGLEVVLRRARKGVGTVTDLDEQPVAGATVRLKKADAPGAPGRRIVNRRRGEEEAGETTDGRGRFVVPDLAAGRYDLSASAEGFSPLTVRGIEVPEGTDDVDLGTVVLAPGLKVHGRVVDGAGAPVAGAGVRVGGQDTRRGTMPPQIVRMMLLSEPVRTTTDGEGAFTVSGLKEGQVSLLVSHEGFVSEPVSGLAVPSDDVLEVVLKPASRVLGRVVDAAGAPFPEARVQVIAEAAGGSATFGLGPRATTGADGTFELEDVEPGPATVEATASGFKTFRLSGLMVPEGGTLEGVELVLEPGAVVSGTVFGPDGRPAIDATVSAEQPGDGRPRFPGGGRNRSDGLGAYSVTGLDVGRYTVVAEHEAFGSTARDLEVEKGVLSYTLDLVFEGGVDLSGRVTGPQGEPVAGAWVNLEQEAYSFNQLQTETGVDGSFVLSGVQAGRYRVRATKEGYAEAKSEEVTVAEAPVTGIELHLSRGVALSGALLGLSAEEISDVSVSASREHDYRSGEVSPDGSYRILDLGPGTWNVSARLRGTGGRASGRVVIGGDEAEVRLDLEFGTGFTLTGKAETNHGPLAGVMVQVSSKTTRSRGVVTTGADGGFRIENLEPGVYNLRLRGFDQAVDHEEEVEMTADQDVAIYLVMARVAGYVRDRFDGAPIADAALQVRRDTEEGPAFLSFMREPRSDARGYFSLGEIPEGSWRVVARRSGYAPSEEVVEVSGAPVEDLEVLLEPTEGVYLAVALDSGGVPPSVNAAVLAGDQVVVSGRFDTTEGGRLRLGEVPAGSFELLVSAPGFATREVGVTSPGRLDTLVLTSGGSVVVRLGDVEDDVVVTVELLGADSRPYRWLGWGGRVLRESRIRSGEGTLEGVAPGTWMVRATAPDGRSWSGSVQVRAGGSSLADLR